MKKKKVWDYLWDMLFILPAFVLFFAVIWYPLIKSILYSFTNYDGMSKSFDFVGLTNYMKIFSSKYIKAGIGNTLKFAVVNCLLCNIFQLLLALVLDKKLILKRYLRVAFYVPVLLCTVVVSVVFGHIMQYNGILNTFFREAGLGKFVIDWFGNETAAFIMVCVVNIWQWLGYGAIIYLGGLQTIPENLYEAAKIDGARPFQIFRKITFPLLMPSVTILTFLNLTGGLKLFDLPYTLTAGAPNDATETVSMVIYRMAFKERKMGYASAVSVIFLLVIAVVSIVQVVATRKKEGEM